MCYEPNLAVTPTDSLAVYSSPKSKQANGCGQRLPETLKQHEAVLINPLHHDCYTY